MKFLHDYPLQVTTLTPLHVGCDENYTPINYVIDEDTLFAFNSAAAADLLPTAAREQLLRLVSDKPNNTTLTQLQRLFYQQREVLITVASHYLPVAAGLAEFYRNRVGQVAQQESDGKNVINQLSIDRTFYNPTNQQSVIPGTSIKGAIRTALLDLVNNSNPLLQNEKAFLNGNKKEQQKANKHLQERVLHYSPGRRYEDGEAEGFEKDPLRLVHLADANWTSNIDNSHEVRFAVNRSRRAPKEGEKGRSMAEDKGLVQLLETVPSARLRAFSSQLTLHDPGDIRQQDKLPAKALRWTMNDIAAACNDFYLPLLQAELKLLDQRQYVAPAWAQRMHRLLEVIAPLLDKQGAFLLRVGRHSGAEAVTLNGVRSIEIMLGKYKENIYEDKPRTVWLAADTQTMRSDMLPFGWLLIEINPPAEPPETLSELLHSNEDDDWVKRQERKIATLQAGVREQQAVAEAKQAAQLAEQQAEAADEAKRTAMTEEERSVDDLRRWYEEDQANNVLTNQGRVSGRLSELLQLATKWPAEPRLLLAELGETIYRKLGMLGGKKGKDRKAKLQALRD